MSKRNDIHNNEIIEYLIKNSIFTKRQIEVIYNRKGLLSGKKVSRGAYYRVLKQCKDNIKKVIVSIILLEILGVIDNEKREILIRVMNQLHSIESSDIDATNVILILSEIIRLLSRI